MLVRDNLDDEEFKSRQWPNSHRSNQEVPQGFLSYREDRTEGLNQNTGTVFIPNSTVALSTLGDNVITR